MGTISPSSGDLNTNKGTYVSLTADNHAVADITALHAETDRMYNDPEAPEVGFMIRVTEPWGSYPGEPNGDGGYMEGTGHNLNCATLIVTFNDDGAPTIERIDTSSKHWRPEIEKSDRQRREKLQSEEAKRQRKAEEAARLRERAKQLERELDDV